MPVGFLKIERSFIASVENTRGCSHRAGNYQPRAALGLTVVNGR
jgi:hypothetical protein